MKLSSSLLAIVSLTLLFQGAVNQCAPGQFNSDPSGTPICTSCPTNTYTTTYDATICSACSNCLSCQATTGNCFSCAPGKGASGNDCIDCIANTFSTGYGACATCTGCASCQVSTGNCLTCPTGSGFVGASSGMVGTVCSACTGNTFSAGGYGGCRTCTGCASCDADTGSCLTCPYGSSLTGTTCTTATVICPAGTVIDVNGCTSCGTNTYSLGGTYTCLSCSCATCSAATGDCLTCPAGQRLSGSSCINDCNVANYALFQGQCVNCGVLYCDTCVNTNNVLNCTTCFTGYNRQTINGVTTCTLNCPLSNCASCLNSVSCGECNTGFTLDLNTYTCTPNVQITNCAKYSGTKCTLCETGYILIGFSGQICKPQCEIANCLSCVVSAYGQCASCVSPMVPNSDGTSCVHCSALNCASCITNDDCGVCAYPYKMTKHKQCFMCSIDNCETCGGDNHCIECAKGYSVVYPNQGLNYCVACLDPCSSCNSDGSCSHCSAPYSQTYLAAGQTCFLCDDPLCISCTSKSIGTCTDCVSGNKNLNGVCQPKCMTGCGYCNTSSTCEFCDNFYYSDNGICKACPGYPACTNCLNSNPSTCTICSKGYWLNADKTCSPCQSHCRQCNSSTFCIRLYNPIGRALVKTSPTSNMPAACDPNCLVCSKASPNLCSICSEGFYQTSEQTCQPCLASSLCATCPNKYSPATCFSCFPGHFMASNSTCLPCQYPCISCIGSNASACSKCPIGFTLIVSSNTCLPSYAIKSSFGVDVDVNCANQVLTQSYSNYEATCSLCLQGYTSNYAGCVPCVSGCQVCSSSAINLCIQCSAGWIKNQVGQCSKASDEVCPLWCSSCTSLGCTACQSPYFLNQDFMCQLPCLTPCASCSTSDPNSCNSCLLGYTLSGSSCVPDTSCNQQDVCQVCPAGYAISSNKYFASSLIQSCVPCAASSNCARCLASNVNTCTSCAIGKYLNGDICSDCPSNCASCNAANQCTSCKAAFVPIQSGSIEGNLVVGFTKCAGCSWYCASCSGSQDFCTSCISGFTLKGDICLSDFNYHVSVVLSVSIVDFEDNYHSFMQKMADTSGVEVSNIVVNHIVSSPVVVDLSISTFSTYGGSTSQFGIESSLNTLLGSGSVTNMTVAYYTVNTVGDSNKQETNSDDEGMSTTTIIILATVIPISLLIIVAAVVIFCMQKRKQEQESDMTLLSSPNATDCNIELSKNQTKKVYA